MQSSECWAARSGSFRARRAAGPPRRAGMARSPRRGHRRRQHRSRREQPAELRRLAADPVRAALSGRRAARRRATAAAGRACASATRCPSLRATSIVRSARAARRAAVPGRRWAVRCPAAPRAPGHRGSGYGGITATSSVSPKDWLALNAAVPAVLRKARVVRVAKGSVSARHSQLDSSYRGFSWLKSRRIEVVFGCKL
jgi:hypothetical protein